MPDVRWLIRRQERTIITAPDAPAGAEVAAERLDAALDGFPGRRPAWFRPLERLGYWWYPICMAATTAFFVARAPNSLAMNIAYGLGFGVSVAVLSGGLLSTAAYLHARTASRRSIAETIDEAAALARPADGVAERVRAILAWDPTREHEVHRLAWRAASLKDDQDSIGADEALVELWKQADPAAAEAYEAELRRVEEMLERHRRRNEER